MICIKCKENKTINEFYDNYKRCKSCCIEESKKNNLKNRKDWSKYIRPQKSEKELNDIKKKLDSKNYIDNAIDYMANIISKKI